MIQLKGRKAQLQRQVADAENPPPLLHPEMATFTANSQRPPRALQDDTEATRLKAGEILRSLVKEIILTPEQSELKIDLRGDLAGILALSLKTKPRPRGPGFHKLRWLRG